MLYAEALKGDADCNGIISFNYYSGEPVTDTAEGRPLLVRMPDTKFSLANFMRAQLYGTMATLRLGMNILFDKENVQIEKLLGHGGLFKTPVVGQKLMAGALNTPVAVMETAGEGGAWGIALLAAYMVNNHQSLALADYLESEVFAGDAGVEIAPRPEDVEGFNRYIKTYQAGLPIEQAAVDCKK
jgi:sugar (pentulose or hexulose) kinase